MTSVILSFPQLTHTFKKKKKCHSDKMTVTHGVTLSVTLHVIVTESEAS